MPASDSDCEVVFVGFGSGTTRPSGSTSHSSNLREPRNLELPNIRNNTQKRRKAARRLIVRQDDPIEVSSDSDRDASARSYVKSHVKPISRTDVVVIEDSSDDVTLPQSSKVSPLNVIFGFVVPVLRCCNETRDEKHTRLLSRSRGTIHIRNLMIKRWTGSLQMRILQRCSTKIGTTRTTQIIPLYMLHLILVSKKMCVYSPLSWSNSI